MKTLLLTVSILAAISSGAQQTIYVAPANTQQQQVDQLNQSFKDLGDSFQQTREIKLRREQYEREMRLREQQAATERLEQQRRMEAAQKEYERQQAEINRKRAKKEAYKKAQIYFESESLDAQPKLASLRQKLASLESNRTIRKEVR